MHAVQACITVAHALHPMVLIHAQGTPPGSYVERQQGNSYPSQQHLELRSVAHMLLTQTLDTRRLIDGLDNCFAHHRS